MAKSKAQTPQEVYRARKQREEQEKIVLLPPGLLNHGNTCFMNSVLQGLIATRLLSDLVHFKPISPAIQHHYTPASRKSPLLTNGHKLGGQYEQSWVDSMPIGDVFLDLMVKAWDSQSSRNNRENLSPKQLLATLGRKYDQYLDFAQQDAHEFLRILLDASRMEELDVIKKRQPPVENAKKRHRTTITLARIPSQSSTLPHSIPEEDALETLSDMIFGGQFASILVCRECKHVSQTYEDFNDISLSIKVEDYQSRKRDRLKNFAKRLTSFPATSLGVSSEVRPSSVPPVEQGERHLAGQEPPTIHEPRRRSFDIVPGSGDPDSDTSASASKEDAVASLKKVTVTGITADNGKGKHIEISPSAKPDRKEKNDGWAKFGRRISMTVGMKKKERNSSELSRPGEAPPMDSVDSGTSIASEGAPLTMVASPAPITTINDDTLPHSRSTSRPPSRPVTPPSHSRLNSHKPRPFHTSRPKTPKAPKPTIAELNYLREILADITPSSHNPFTFLKPPQHTQSNRSVSAPGASQNLWLSMNHFSGIEECLRMFTSVEILDGENMVGCRRCWKIANGEYDVPSPVDEGNGDEEYVDVEITSVPPVPPPRPMVTPNGVRKPRLVDLSPLRPAALTNLPTSMSTPTVSLYTHPNSSDPRTVSSLPTTAPSSIHESDVDAVPSVKLVVATNDDASATGRISGEVATTIPFIMTTAPDSPLRPSAHYMERSNSLPLDKSGPVVQPAPRLGQVLKHFPTVPQDTRSLPVPSGLRRVDSDGDESSGAESDASAESSSQSHPPRTAGSVRKKPKPVIMRPAYKRYLIATPPPVLVIHLKRFQQINKTGMLSLSFSHGFKKLDDYVTFPEFLDISPYLAPRKEDFGLGKKGKTESKVAVVGKRPPKGEKCMYRLYAVVVHIGNMLGGHYIAYTALPDAKPPGDPEAPNVSSSTEVKVPRQWAYISDTIVRLTTLEEVLKAKAYICMYERI
ncbi:hypothetical protein H0H92_014326 [Tricholoma furcatifolium]|nr:hypothetical protein H0H92_014326 [Tricholoma furcatifolium]